jgi:hypothetical protein
MANFILFIALTFSDNLLQKMKLKKSFFEVVKMNCANEEHKTILLHSSNKME